MSTDEDGSREHRSYDVTFKFKLNAVKVARKKPM